LTDTDEEVNVSSYLSRFQGHNDYNESILQLNYTLFYVSTFILIVTMVLDML